MSPSPPSLSPTLTTHRALEFLLNLTKYAGQRKVPILEWLLAWTTVVVFGIRYLIDYARLRWNLHSLASEASSPSSSNQRLCDRISLCPLAHTEDQLAVTAEERWERLRQALLRSPLSSALVDNGDSGSIDASTECSSGNDSASISTLGGSSVIEGAARKSHRKKKPKAASLIVQMTKEWTDDDWITIVWSDLDVRREASYLMHTLSKSLSSPRKNGLGALVVLSKLRRLWPQFLQLPESILEQSSSSSSDNEHDLSLIVPMYKEKVTDISYTLNKAFDNCSGDPKRIQVVVVHVQSSPTDENDDDGNSLLRQQLLQQEQQQKEPPQPSENNSNEDERPSLTSSWGELKVVTIPYGQGGGRGKTLNVGAKHATASILTFLHADTMVPAGWDEQIKKALTWNNNISSSNGSGRDNGNSFFPHACAFTMAIDVDSYKTNGASSPLSSHHRKEPAGLLGAEWLGVLRCHCGLPYGDSVLSFGRPMFDYMGGYPEQPLMEDYEAMDWLRLRSVLLSTIHKNEDRKTTPASNPVSSKNGLGAEGLVLLRDRARCSPRRWEKYGVAYTSLVNAMCIFRYNSNATAEDLFDFYYHCNKQPQK